MRFTICLLVLQTMGLLNADQLPARAYNSADGLPMSRINDMLMDKLGFMWFATDQGLSRFDGHEFRNLGLEDGLPSKVITALLQDRDGTYWLGTNKGLCHFDGSRFTLVPLGPANFVTVLFQDSRRRIWCGAFHGLFLLKQPFGKQPLLEPVPGLQPTSNDTTVSAIAEDAAGVVWASYLDTLYNLKDEAAPIAFRAADGIPGRISSLLLDRKGRLWMGTWRGLCLLNSSGAPGPVVQRVWHRKDGLCSDLIHELYRSSDGTVWVLTEHGLSSWNEASDQPVFRIHHDAQGWLAAHNEVAAEDCKGSLWVGTEAHGIIRIALNGLTTFGKAEGLLSDKIRDLFEDKAGDPLVVTRIDSPDPEVTRRYRGHILYRLNDDFLNPVNPAYPQSLQKPGWGERQVVLQDHLGEWWITSEQGLFRFPAVPLEKLPQTSPLAHYTSADGLLSNDVFRLHEDARADIWIGVMGAGTFRWRRASHRFEKIGASRASATAFQDDDAGNTWMGWWSEFSLGRFRNGRLQTFNSSNGLSRGWVHDIFRDHTGRIWVATTDGLSRIDNPAAEVPQIHSYANVNAFNGHRVQCITEDKQGVLYIGTDNGLEVLNPATGALRHFGMADGLPDEDVLSAYCARDGILWFGTHGGLVRLHPLHRKVAHSVPLRILALQIGGRPSPVSHLGEAKIENLRLNPGENVLQIDYTDLAFGSLGQLRFQYLLEGSHAPWSIPSPDRSLHFAGLAPGTYNLSIRAVDLLGQSVSAPVTARFRVMPQFWQTWWFQLLCLAGAATIALIIHRYRISRLIAVQSLRSRIALDLHDEVGSGLSQIAIWSELARRKERPAGDEHLNRIAASSRALIDTIGDIIWTVNPQRDSLRELIQRIRFFATEICTSCDIHLKFEAGSADLDRQANSEIRRDVFLIAKEAIHNAVRHSGCTSIEVRFRIHARSLELEIADNGRGLPPVLKNGNGLTGMRQRAHTLHGSIQWLAAEGCGTRVCLVMPLTPAGLKNMWPKLPV